MTTVADELGIEGPSLVRIIDVLVSEGLVSRRADPQDKRARLLKLTPRGEATVPAVQALIEDNRVRFLSHLDREEIAAMVRGLAKLDGMMHEPARAA